MSKSLVLAEKPSVGKDIAKVLGCGKQGNGYIEGQNYVVTWGFGHLVTLAEPEAYEDRYKTWRLEDLPMLPSPLKLSVIKKSGKQFQTVKNQLKRQDIKDIIIATDAGREGELVARWILQKAGAKKPIKRLWISSVTDQAINQGFKKLRDGRAYHSLYEAAEARSEADWYVGMNATRALTAKHNASLSCGRVQTPTLAMVKQREDEIKSFEPKAFHKVFVTLENGLTLWWCDQQNHDRIFSTNTKDELLQRIKGKDASVTYVKEKKKREGAPLLYDLTELQREANMKFGFSAKETLKVLQSLYETHKVVTYPRTDSRYLSSDLAHTMKERLQACDRKPFSTHVLKIKNNKWSINKKTIDDKKVSDHHALIPTEVAPIYAEMTGEEKQLYELIVNRFLASFFPPAEYEQREVQVQIGSDSFFFNGKNLQNPGWKALYKGTEQDVKKAMPVVTEKESYKVIKIGTEKDETKPPSRLNEASLLSAMENPGRFLNEKDTKIINTLKNAGGIGTVATRADIMEKLLSGNLLEKKGKELHTTSRGRQLLELAPDELKSPVLTAEWEQQLTEIEKGKLRKNEFIKEIQSYTKEAVENIKQSEQFFKHDNVTGTPCPECGKLLLEVKGKHGKRKVCQDRTCGYKKNISKVTNARCPQCKKRMELRGEGEGQIFVCRCGHKEKVAAFNKRRQQEKKNKASKKEVNKYLKKQDGDELKNPALAEALAKFKEKD